MDLADREWRLVTEEVHAGPINMALDAVAAETAAAGGPRTLRVYGWKPSTISLGYTQPATTIDWSFCNREGMSVTRRPTGGGGIYHDEFGDISYSIVVPAAEVPGDLLACYRLLLSPIFDAFKRMGISAQLAETPEPALHQPACYLRALHPAHDVVVSGRKISGNAQYRQKDAIIQHGSITFAREPERHLTVFVDARVTPEMFNNRVTSIRAEAGISRDETVEMLETALAMWADAESGSWSTEERERANEIAAEKFSGDAWIHRC